MKWLVHLLTGSLLLSTVNALVDYVNQSKCDHDRSYRDVSELKVYLYDFDKNVNISGPIDYAGDVIASYLANNVTKNLTMYVPGNPGTIDGDTPERTRQTFRNVLNTYLIIFDFSAYAKPKGVPHDSASFYRAVQYSYQVGKAMGKLISRFNSKGYPSKNIRCFGHSFGGQLLGYIGDTYYELTGERLARLSGIDPAGSCYSNSAIENQLRSGNAEFVEVYHCSDDGTTSVLGDEDIYYNPEREVQPGCEAVVGGRNRTLCSHDKCVKIWLKTVHEPNEYVACKSRVAYSRGCKGCDVIVAGYCNACNGTGVFYASTSEKKSV